MKQLLIILTLRKSLRNKLWPVSIFFILSGMASAFEPSFFSSVETINREIAPTTLYELSPNPVFYQTMHLNDYLYYQTSFSDIENHFKRTYDPEEEREYQAYFYAFKNLNERSSIAASAAYLRTEQTDVQGSIEKHFYEQYISCIDSSQADIKYDGPQLWALYNYRLFDRLLVGLKLDYGVERGLEDVYTQCESIIRNFFLSFGLGYQSINQSFSIGTFGKYYNRQTKLESVKETSDAQVTTFFGYHAYVEENPGSTIRKNDDLNGYEFGLQAERRDLLINGFSIQLAGSLAGRENNVTVGSVSQPRARGYWVREGLKITGALVFYPQNSFGGIQTSIDYRRYDDWIKSGNFDVIIIENNTSSGKVGAKLFVNPAGWLQCAISGEYEQIQDDYREYIEPFSYKKERLNRNASIEFKIRPNIISAIRLKGGFSNNEPYFYWDTDEYHVRRINGQNIALGYERLFLFGTMGLSFKIEKWRPVLVNINDSVVELTRENINSFGIELYYQK